MYSVHKFRVCGKQGSWEADSELEISKQGVSRKHLIRELPGDQHLEEKQTGGGRVSSGAVGPGGVSVKPRMSPWNV